MLVYQDFTSEKIEEVKELYREEGWMSYLRNDEMLISAFDRSLCVYGAFEDEKLIAFVRCVGDGEHIVMVQDLIVAKKYRSKGIGKTLFRAMWDKYAHVRMFQVNTDLEDEVDNGFYKSFGMRPIVEGHMISYFR